MAPEMYFRERPVDPEKADIFALGVILFTIAFRRGPFCEASHEDNVFMALQRNPGQFWEFHYNNRTN